MRDIERIHQLMRHIQGVQENCLILGEKLMGEGRFNFAKILIARGFAHDNSKFFGIEYDYLSGDDSDKEKLKLAIVQHNRTNPHHPEYWDGGIHEMPDIALAEMIADWKTRSEERGTSLVEWIEDEAMKRFNFTKNDPVYEKIMTFVKMLVAPPLKAWTEL
jgi:hypothetical protein